MNEINKHTPYFGYESDKLKQSFNLSEGTEEAVYKFLETYNKSERGQFFAKNSYKKIIYHFEREYKDDLEILNNSFEQFLPIVFEEKCRKNSESLFYFPLSNYNLGSDIIKSLSLYHSPIFIAETPCEYSLFEEFYGSLIGAMHRSDEEFCVMSASQDLFLFVNNPDYILIFLRSELYEELEPLLLTQYITCQKF